jgi:hypothetical protein
MDMTIEIIVLFSHLPSINTKEVPSGWKIWLGTHQELHLRRTCTTIVKFMVSTAVKEIMAMITTMFTMKAMTMTIMQHEIFINN